MWYECLLASTIPVQRTCLEYNITLPLLLYMLNALTDISDSSVYPVVCFIDSLTDIRDLQSNAGSGRLSRDVLLLRNTARWFAITLQEKNYRIKTRHFIAVTIKPKSRDLAGRHTTEYTTATSIAHTRIFRYPY